MKVKHIKRFDQDTFIIKLNDQFNHVRLAILPGYNNNCSLYRIIVKASSGDHVKHADRINIKA